MRTDTDTSTTQIKSLTPVQLSKDIIPQPSQIRPKFNISMEKKIEHLWLESESRGWNFNDFVVVVMEVLTILHHRNTLRTSETWVGKLVKKKA